MSASAASVGLALFREVCRIRSVEITTLCDGRVLALKRGGQTAHVYGWDFGVNSSTAVLICRNKAACSAVLRENRIPCLPHLAFYRPDREDFGFEHQASWSKMVEYLNSHPQGVVCKPNDLSRGVSVRRVSSVAELEKAVYDTFRYSRELCLSPFVSIDAEYRVVLLNGYCRLMYVKRLPTVTGDGVSMLGELIAATYATTWKGDHLAEHIEEVQRIHRLDYIPDRKEVLPVGWRHNLAHGALAELVDPSSPQMEVIVKMAIQSARALGVAFAAVDVADVAGNYQILEVNTGIGTERLLRQVPTASDLVQKLYGAAVEQLFHSPERV
jgi:glutathione synthase/RimK-type ligase-like ATP-grasp enzyme